jgi:hypothetical protein
MSDQLRDLFAICLMLVASVIFIIALLYLVVTGIAAWRAR